MCYQITNSLKKIFPILDWLPNYKASYLKGDLFAGLTVGAILIPQGISYAIIAGLPPIYGLYTALVPQIMYTILLVTLGRRDEEAVTRLSRVGFDNALGYLDGNFDACKNAAVVDVVGGYGAIKNTEIEKQHTFVQLRSSYLLEV